jgi:hypothetical protein
MERIRVALQNKRGLTPSNAISVEPEALDDLCFHVPGRSLCCSGSGTFTQHQLNSAWISHYSTEFQGSRDIHLSSPSLIGASPISVSYSLFRPRLDSCPFISLSLVCGAHGSNPNAIISHSLGEYAALQMSGVLSTSDAIFLIGHRARLLETRCQL